MFTSGGTRENGDRFGPAYLGNGAGGNKSDPNPDYDPNGYDYTVELSGGASNGMVALFDPMFCATGNNGHGGSYGAGDHWTDHVPSQVVAPVAVTYRLYNMNGTPLDTTDDGPPIATLHYDPGTKTMGDFSGDFGTPTNSTDPNRQDCSTNPGHNKWVTLALGPGPGHVPGQRQHDRRQRQHERRRGEPVLHLHRTRRAARPASMAVAAWRRTPT